MSIFEYPARLAWISGINDISGKTSSGIREWLELGAYVPDSIQSPTEFVLTSHSSEMLTLLAQDADRVLRSSIETILSVGEVEDLPRSIAWLAVKLYYAAFFAANAHLRLSGRSCLRIDGRERVVLNSVYDSYGTPNTNITGGQYLCKFDPTTGKLSFTKASSGLGAHEFLWACYKEFLDEHKVVVEQTITLESLKKGYIAKISTLNDILCRSGANAGNWLSSTRNNINYKLGYGVWFPYGIPKASSAKMISQIRQFYTTDPASLSVSCLTGQKHDLQAFYEGCLFLTNLVRMTALDLSRRCSSGKSFLSYGSLALMNQANLSAA